MSKWTGLSSTLSFWTLSFGTLLGRLKNHVFVVVKVSPGPPLLPEEDKVEEKEEEVEEVEEVVGAKEDLMPQLHHLDTGMATVRTSNVRTYLVANLDTPRLSVG